MLALYNYIRHSTYNEIKYGKEEREHNVYSICETLIFLIHGWLGTA